MVFEVEEGEEQGWVRARLGTLYAFGYSLGQESSLDRERWVAASWEWGGRCTLVSMDSLSQIYACALMNCKSATFEYAILGLLRKRRVRKAARPLVQNTC